MVGKMRILPEPHSIFKFFLQTQKPETQINVADLDSIRADASGSKSDAQAVLLSQSAAS